MEYKFISKALFILTLVGLSTVAFAAPTRADENLTRQALIYKGPGSCEEDCSESAVEIAKLAGFEPVFVAPDMVDPAIFANAAVWIQPGGKSSTVAKTMAPILKQNLRDFIAAGGGYVGFCAGGFFATALIGSTGNEGLGILPGSSALLESDKDAIMVEVTWGTSTRSLYWEGGPFFKFTQDDPVEVTATYADGTVASARSSYGLGRVYVTGPHPEAPQYWRDYFELEDADGLDSDLAAEMVTWAAAAPSYVK
ncbi:MAG: BPL-N domain-containing protein [Bdellovibrionota bacterium]